MTRALILALSLFACAVGHAQPSAWQSYQTGSTTHYEGTDRNGGHWSGASYRSGSTIFFDAYGPNGQQRHCRSYDSGGIMYTNCW